MPGIDGVRPPESICGTAGLCYQVIQKERDFYSIFLFRRYVVYINPLLNHWCIEFVVLGAVNSLLFSFCYDKHVYASFVCSHVNTVADAKTGCTSRVN